MNHALLNGALALAILGPACTRNADTLPVRQQKEITLTASTEGGPDTRTVLAEDHTTVLWNPYDEITVFSAGESSKFTSQNSESQKQVSFKGTISVVTGTAEGDDAEPYIYGLYPYRSDATQSGETITTTLPTVQTGLPDSFPDDTFISMGRSHTYSMGFWNVCSGLRFSFTEDGFTSVTLTSNNGTPLAGRFTATFNEEGKPTVVSTPSPSASVTLTAPDGEFLQDTWYYVTTLPGVHANGYTLTASTGFEAQSYSVDEEKTFTRSRFRQLAGLDERMGPRSLSLTPLDDPEMVFASAVNSTSSYKRIPAITITPQGAFLAATEHRPNKSDAAKTSIIIARKTRNGEWWTFETKHLGYNTDGWGKFMNPSFTIDELGAHGPAGRIYLFFLATTVSTGLAMNSTANQINTCYVYSDDDGVTWSDIDCIPKSAWTDPTCLWQIPAPANGLQTEDGTLVIPCMGRDGTTSNDNWYSGILYKKPDEDWAYSPKTETAKDNECTVYIGPDDEIYLNCRNENTGHSRSLYRFDLSDISFTQVENPFDPRVVCQGTICNASYDGTDFYLMSFCDPVTYNNRAQITVWGSWDALHWTPVIRLNGTDWCAGYSAVAFRDGICGVVWEHDSDIKNIGFFDLTPHLHLFTEYLPPLEAD